ncbi:peptidylprolyl isomerase [Acinetobacter sp. CAAS 2-6]|uniref:peptidylprolyl isomerase n=1 Tax=Acinetobacter sp. CAAS 2-6 TaxID=3016358 RepID=UPI002DD68755|nr:peptidylprolyl isomerase [Acinetobacter sp. CAAS 2-6]
MKTKYIQQFFKATTLALCISVSTPSFAQPANDEVIAVVDNSVILRSDLNQLLAETNYQSKQQNQTLPPQSILEQQALEKLILRQAELQQVKRYGLKADERALNETVLKVAQQFKASSLEELQQKLDAQEPGSYAALRSRIADDLAINQLRQQQVMSRIKISDQDVANFLKSPQGQAALGNQVHLIHVRISATGQDQTAQATAQQVRTALQNSNDVATINKQYSNNGIQVEGADMGFRNLAEIPAELAAQAAALQAGQTSALIPLRDGIHLIKLIERKNSEQRAIVPQYQTRHILIQPSEVVSRDNAKQIIENIYNRLKAGEDFAVLAATFSNDPGSARDGGSLGWVNPGVMVPEFEEKMKNTPVGQISEPFQTQFGWHILQVTETRQQDMTNEYQERMARQILGERQFDTELDSWLREVRGNAYVEIKDPELAKK